ncbi:hypothetical protein TVNIR_0553 [Thioalkalivibrio nitratireducens DSM 14787]|uniref:Uncharacterized protein n=1 Tax=Thioalkalivibrio nitratireducens (strain DSM 14787 / UNIQEM 213 / ALEN2) TaxID=1255043 RepID=L0DTD3_THIND|nr:hypothetical protein TVNIR_0553 [Thioalkalivibrio nitratireducens DSM 14787]
MIAVRFSSCVRDPGTGAATALHGGSGLFPAGPWGLPGSLLGDRVPGTR